MTREEILDALYDLKNREQAALADYSHDSHRQILQQRIEALDYAMCIISNTGWIPCEDRLPEEDGIYLINDRLHKGCDWVHTAGFKKSSKSWCENHGVYYDDHYGRYSEQERIIAWMPLPEPYKEA